MSWRFRRWPLPSFSRPRRSPHQYFSSSTSTFQKKKKLKKRNPSLHPDLLRSSLPASSSDLLSLSFFLWSARHPGFSQDRPSFLRMVDVVSRLHRRHRGFPGLVHQLSLIGCPMKPRTFLVLLQICWLGGCYDLVVDVFDQLDALGFSLNTFAFNVLIDVLFKTGHTEDALRVLQRVPAPNFLSFNISLCHLCRANDVASCVRVLRSMSRKGFYPDPRTFGLVLDVLCKNSRLAEACQVLSVMVTLGVPLSALVWSILIDGFCRTKRFQMAFCLLEKMRRADCSPTVVTYTSFIKALLESKMVDAALSMSCDMEAEGCVPDLILCNVLIHGLSRNGRYADAIGVFVRMAERRLVPDRYTFSSLFSAIFSSRSFHILPNLVGNHVIDADRRVYNSLLTYFCKANFPSLAVQLFRKMMIGLTPDKFSFVGLLNGLHGRGKLEEAVCMYSVMSHAVLDNHACTVVMQALIRVGKCDEAINLFRQAVLEKSTLDSVSYAVAMQGLFKVGRGCEVAALYDRMKESGISPDWHVYNVMIAGYCKNKDAEMALQVQQEMVDAGIHLSCANVDRISSRFNKSGSGRTLLIETRDSEFVHSLAAGPSSSSKVVIHAELAACPDHPDGILEDDSISEASSSEEMLDMIAAG